VLPWEPATQGLRPAQLVPGKLGKVFFLVVLGTTIGLKVALLAFLAKGPDQDWVHEQEATVVHRIAWHVAAGLLVLRSQSRFEVNPGRAVQLPAASLPPTYRRELLTLGKTMTTCALLLPVAYGALSLFQWFVELDAGVATGSATCVALTDHGLFLGKFVCASGEKRLVHSNQIVLLRSLELLARHLAKPEVDKAVRGTR